MLWFFFFFKQKTAYEISACLVGSEMCIRDRFSAQFLFPSYTSATKCNGNSASAALNKWLKQYTGQGVIHSFRHSFRDRLREAEVDVELTDQLGGWASSTIGQSYGSGHTLKQKYNAMQRIVLNTSP